MTQSLGLTEMCRREVGDALRIAAVYTETEFEHLYLREDLDRQYTPAEIVTLRRELIVFALGKQQLADVTHAGKVRQIICEMDDAIALQFPVAGHFGVFVSIEASERDSLFDLGDAVEAWIEQGGLPAREES
ncbi:DUF7522 family protein [Halorussus aquaticus]|uniref:Uncharacterized protein n=1 Tax=Halorussus aquaticus TaxID=2953748 RepID=A0ABD5Q1N7_9EURY|nr:hypothetical protein [Halorussus aquaticus]